MKKLVLSLIAVSLLTFFILQGCKNEQGIVPKPPETHCDSINVSYNLEVKPIVTAKCASFGCHDGSVGSAPHNFTIYDDLSGVSHTVSVRIQLPTTHFQHMPQGNTLTPEELETMLCWIENGALNN